MILCQRIVFPVSIDNLKFYVYGKLGLLVNGYKYSYTQKVSNCSIIVYRPFVDFHFISVISIYFVPSNTSLMFLTLLEYV